MRAELSVGSTVPTDLVIHDNEGYVRYVKHRKTYNYGITKDRKIRLMVNLSKRRDELERYKNQFEKLLTV